MDYRDWDQGAGWQRERRPDDWSRSDGDQSGHTLPRRGSDPAVDGSGADAGASNVLRGGAKARARWHTTEREGSATWSVGQDASLDPLDDTGAWTGGYDPWADDPDRRGPAEPGGANGWRSGGDTSGWRTRTETEGWRTTTETTGWRVPGGDTAWRSTGETTGWQSEGRGAGWQPPAEPPARQPAISGTAWPTVPDRHSDRHPATDTGSWVSSTDTSVGELMSTPWSSADDTGSGAWSDAPADRRDETTPHRRRHTEPDDGPRQGRRRAAEPDGRPPAPTSGAWAAPAGTGSWAGYGGSPAVPRRETGGGGRRRRAAEPEPVTGGWGRLDDPVTDTGSWRRDPESTIDPSDTGSWRRDGEAGADGRRRRSEGRAAADTGGWRRETDSAAVAARVEPVGRRRREPDVDPDARGGRLRRRDDEAFTDTDPTRHRQLAARHRHGRLAA